MCWRDAFTTSYKVEIWWQSGTVDLESVVCGLKPENASIEFI